jgi:hypothetical protein
MKPKTKRITLPVSGDIEAIRDQLTHDTGVKMTYNQVINFLIHFYMVRAHQPTLLVAPRTEWRHPK